MNESAPDTGPTPHERIDALEYVLGHALLALEADNAAKAARIDRLERALKQAAPEALPPPAEDESDEPFTLDSLERWMGLCLQAMRTHQSLPARQIVAIGDTATRVLGLGDALGQEAQADASTRAAAHAALLKARHQPPGQ